MVSRIRAFKVSIDLYLTTLGEPVDLRERFFSSGDIGKLIATSGCMHGKLCALDLSETRELTHPGVEVIVDHPTPDSAHCSLLIVHIYILRG